MRAPEADTRADETNFFLKKTDARASDGYSGGRNKKKLKKTDARARGWYASGRNRWIAPLPYHSARAVSASDQGLWWTQGEFSWVILKGVV
jgi:hypothetical protein